MAKENEKKFTSHFFLSLATFLKKIKPMLRKERGITFSLNDLRVVSEASFLKITALILLLEKSPNYINAMFDN